MSQAKVDRYKKEKANRQKMMKREKMERLCWKLGGSLIGLLAIGWIGFSAYNTFHVPVAKSYEVNVDAISDYMSDLNTEDIAE